MKNDPSESPEQAPGQAGRDLDQEAVPKASRDELVRALQTIGLRPSEVEAASRARQISVVVREDSVMFGGPLPPPHVLAEYNQVLPGLAEKIVGWVEQQRDFRQGEERERSLRSQARMDRGQTIAAAIAIFGLTLSATLGVVGNPFVAVAIATVSIGGPTAAVYLARRAPASASARSDGSKPDNRPG